MTLHSLKFVLCFALLRSCLLISICLYSRLDRRPQGMSEYVRILFGMLFGLCYLALVFTPWLVRAG